MYAPKSLTLPLCAYFANVQLVRWSFRESVTKCNERCLRHTAIGPSSNI